MAPTIFVAVNTAKKWSRSDAKVREKKRSDADDPMDFLQEGPKKQNKNLTLW